ncbi:MAG TPA: metallophosphoesterase family protein [Longimicrobium sp.]|nr:metallophosphoesterase family protein [Longimicrobium sp.]
MDNEEKPGGEEPTSADAPAPVEGADAAEAHPAPSTEPMVVETEGIGGQPDLAASESAAAPPADPPPPTPESPPPPAAAPVASAESASVNVLEVRSLDWNAVHAAVANPPAGERAERIIAAMEERLAGGGPLGTAFEEYAAGPADQAIQVGDDWPVGEVWFVGDLHGDLLALEAALQHVDRGGGGADARLVFLGDLFDDGAHAAEVVLRIFELMLQGPMRVVVLAGNHDEALSFGEGRFQSSVLPSDFTGWLNEQCGAGHPWAERLGKLIIRFFRRAPRALFFPDGLLVAHAGIPHTDLHPELAESGNWNDPRVLTDFVWLRAHPRARKRIPNRTTRGSEFGREDFAAFCQLATRLGRPIGRMLRGHDHVEERFAVFPAWAAHPVLTINTLSHRLPREVFGPYERVPVVARWVRGELPEVRRLFIPPELVREVYPEPVDAHTGEGG